MRALPSVSPFASRSRWSFTARGHASGPPPAPARAALPALRRRLRGASCVGSSCVGSQVVGFVTVLALRRPASGAYSLLLANDLLRKVCQVERSGISSSPSTSSENSSMCPQLSQATRTDRKPSSTFASPSRHALCMTGLLDMDFPPCPQFLHFLKAGFRSTATAMKRSRQSEGGWKPQSLGSDISCSSNCVCNRWAHNGLPWRGVKPHLLQPLQPAPP